MASRSLLVLVVLSLFLCSYFAQAHRVQIEGEEGEAAAVTGTVDQLVNPNNNPVVTKPLGHYFFWYGDFSNSSGPDYYTPGLIRQFLADIAGTTYTNILSQYDGSTGSADINPYFAGETFITGYPDGHVLASQQSNCFNTLLKKYLKAYNIVPNTYTQYYIMYSHDVYYAKGACEQSVACGYHTWDTDAATGVKYLWGQVSSSTGSAGGPGVRCGGNSPQGPYSVASNVALSVFSHELFETVTDPYVNAWQDSTGITGEIGDKCAYIYGTTTPSTFKQGAQYNLKFNGHEYLVQQEYSNAAQACTLSLAFNGPPPPPPPVNNSPNPSGVALPSAQASPAPGSSPSSTAQVPVSPSIEATQSIIPTLDKAVGGCIACRKVCRKYRKVQRVCASPLGGTFTVNNATKTICCTNLATSSFSFGWTEIGSSCEYSLYYTKLWKLCDALGGHVTCGPTASLSGARLTCTR